MLRAILLCEGDGFSSVGVGDVQRAAPSLPGAVDLPLSRRAYHDGLVAWALLCFIVVARL